MQGKKRNGGCSEGDHEKWPPGPQRKMRDMWNRNVQDFALFFQIDRLLLNREGAHFSAESGIGM
jgi:hypothetical protein